jgi:hypothetical protein
LKGRITNDGCLTIWIREKFELRMIIKIVFGGREKYIDEGNSGRKFIQLVLIALNLKCSLDAQEEI